jgi:hypothetical protein
MTNAELSRFFLNSEGDFVQFLLTEGDLNTKTVQNQIKNSRSFLLFDPCLTPSPLLIVVVCFQ